MWIYVSVMLTLMTDVQAQFDPQSDHMTIKHEPQRKVTWTGNDVTLTGIVPAGSLLAGHYRSSWTKDNQSLLFDKNRYRLEHQGLHLQIKNVRLEDAGDYALKIIYMAFGDASFMEEITTTRLIVIDDGDLCSELKVLCKGYCIPKEQRCAGEKFPNFGFVHRSSDNECTNLKEFSTDTTYQYRYLASSSPVTRVDFKAKAKNDVHIALSDGPEDKPALYEIVIGGWGNTQSVIRRSKQGNTKIEASTPSILSPTEFRGFWITYNNGVIKVGKEGQAAFMEWTDPTPLPVNNIGYSTGWGSNGEFKFCVDEPVQECTNLKEFSTDTTYQYRYLASSSPVTRVDFKAKAKNDVHIALSDGPEDKPALYEIVIGGWGNTQSVIRRSKQGNTKIEASTPSILSPTEFRGFWITYNNGVIKVGKEGQAAFMEWTDPTPLPVNNIGYSTGWGSNGEFKFCVDEPVQECTNLKEFSTDTTYQYRYLASSSPVTRVDFKAKANNDVHIALSDGPEDKPALYEIVI
ncbi:uncharacterized protein LOC144434206 [Glandiceps talaboti]